MEGRGGGSCVSGLNGSAGGVFPNEDTGKITGFGWNSFGPSQLCQTCSSSVERVVLMVMCCGAGRWQEWCSRTCR